MFSWVGHSIPLYPQARHCTTKQEKPDRLHTQAALIIISCYAGSMNVDRWTELEQNSIRMQNPLSAVRKKSCWPIRILVSGSDLQSLVAALLVLIREYPVSYLSEETSGKFFVHIFSPCRQISGQRLKWGHDLFILHSFQYLCTHYLKL